MGEAQFEKVEKGLDCCTKRPPYICDGGKMCPYHDEAICVMELRRDALDLIRQQQERIKELEEAQRMMVYQDCLRPDWISVKDILPAGRTNPITLDFEEVLCATTFGDVRAYKYGKRLGDTDAHFWHGAGIMDRYVTHWQYMPKHPKEVQRDT